MRKISKKKIIVIIIILAIAAFGGYRYLSTRTQDGKIEGSRLREVQVVLVSDLFGREAPLSLIGEVTSISEAIVKTEAQGEVTGIFSMLGDFVNAGQIIAEIENASQRASVLQAQGAVESAQAALLRTKQGSREEQLSIIESKLENQELLLSEARLSTVNTLQSAFVTADDVIRNKADQLFSNSRSANPLLAFAVTDSQLKIDLEFERFVIEQKLVEWNDSLGELTVSSDLFLNIQSAKDNLTQIRAFLDKAALGVNALTPSANISQTTIDSWKASVLAARTNTNTALGSLSSANDNLNSKITALEIAQAQQRQGLAGGRSEDVLQGEALLKQAEGSLGAARAQFEKTIIRAPISGTINKLNVERGNFVSVFESAVTIANNDALEITTFITEEDRRNIVVGAEAVIEGGWSGVVTEIAPAVDRETKKIEMKIAIVDPEADLLSGESVELKVIRSFKKLESREEFIIPISALKVGTDKIIVFTVDERNILIANQVAVGSIVGDGVIILSGIEPEMRIVLDARGLNEGEEVLIRR